MPQLTPGHSPTWSFQAEIQYRLSSSSSRWMDWLRKLRGRAQGFREGQGQTQAPSGAGRSGDGTQESCPLPRPPPSPTVSTPPSTLCSSPGTCHPSFAQASPPLWTLLPPESSPRPLTALLTGEPVKPRGPRLLTGAVQTALFSPEKIYSNVQILFQNHSKFGFLGEGWGPHDPKDRLPHHVSPTSFPRLGQHDPHLPQQDDEAQRRRACYTLRPGLCPALYCPGPRALPVPLTGNRLNVAVRLAL